MSKTNLKSRNIQQRNRSLDYQDDTSDDSSSDTLTFDDGELHNNSLRRSIPLNYNRTRTNSRSNARKPATSNSRNNARKSRMSNSRNNVLKPITSNSRNNSRNSRMSNSRNNSRKSTMSNESRKSAVKPVSARNKRRSSSSNHSFDMTELQYALQPTTIQNSPGWIFRNGYTTKTGRRVRPTCIPRRRNSNNIRSNRSKTHQQKENDQFCNSILTTPSNVSLDSPRIKSIVGGSYRKFKRSEKSTRSNHKK